MTRDEDELWQEIVDNYGTRASVDDAAAAGEEPEETEPVDPSPGEHHPQIYALPDPEPLDPPELRDWDDTGRYVPPPPAPIPLAEPPRMLGWLGVFAAPLIALVALVLGHPFRGLLAVLLVAWFIGGFLYLVRTMPDEPREPWDDGSRI